MSQKGKKRTVYILGARGDYQNYHRAMELTGGQIQFGGDPEECDALLLPGGGDLEPWRYRQKNCGSYNLNAERDDRELALLDLFIQQKKPVLGICRGLQVINVFFGGTLLQDIEGHCTVNDADRYHTVRTASVQLRNLFGEQMIVNSAHHQGVDRVGAGLNAIQWTPDGTIEAICHDELPIWAVQWHPERMLEQGGNKLLRFWLDT